MRFPLIRKRQLFVKQTSKEVIEAEEILPDAHVSEDDLRHPDRKFEIPLQPSSFLFISFVIGALFGFLFLKVVSIALFQHHIFSQELTAQYLTREYLLPPRGIIYDRNFHSLTHNKISFDLVGDRTALEHLFASQENKKILGDLLHISPDTFEEILEESKKSVVRNYSIVQNLTEEQLIAFASSLYKFSGLELRERFVREYPYKELYAHAIGYLGRINKDELDAYPSLYTQDDIIGKNGLEMMYEKVLRGNPGLYRVERNAAGVVVKNFIERTPITEGHLLLYIDHELQQRSFRSLQQTLMDLGLKKGVVIAMEPRTGGVRALVSLPSYDPGVFVQGGSEADFKKLFSNPSKPLFNRAVSGQYPAGSSIKPLLASAALQEKIVNPSDVLFAPEALYIPHPYNPDIVYQYPDWRFHGWINIIQAIAESSNTFFYQIGGGYKNQNGLGIYKINEYVQRFGWGKKTGIDLPGEDSGFLPTPEWKERTRKETWYVGDTYNVSIGQGDVGITPIQLTSAMSAIANGGVLYTPHIVDKIVDNKREVLHDTPPSGRGIGISNEILAFVREGMYKATQPGGTAMALALLPVKVGAKTGTAQPSKNAPPHSWITVFAPYENPEIVLTVLIENGGGQTASPATRVAYDILKWYFEEK